MSPPVHTNPRECRSVSRGEPPCRGLSPPVRGSLGVRRVGLSCQRRSLAAVYPRPCGGARGPIPLALTSSGLSPPVRGSRASPVCVGLSPPVRGSQRTWRERSIPVRGSRQVYPRPSSRIPARASSSGLSPPVRGSRWPARSTALAVYPRPSQVGRSIPARRRGSIPARAGEPVPAARRAPSPPVKVSGVYPRPCGGAIAGASRQARTSGLSPPVRGSLLRHRHNRS